MPPVKLGEKGLEIFYFYKQRDAGLFKIDSFAEILSPSYTGGISDVALWGSWPLRDQSEVVRSIAVQSITSGDQSFGLIGTIDRKAIDTEDWSSKMIDHRRWLSLFQTKKKWLP